MFERGQDALWRAVAIIIPLTVERFCTGWDPSVGVPVGWFGIEVWSVNIFARSRRIEIFVQGYPG